MAICTAHRTNGELCRAKAIRGGKVCVVHGGRAPQVLRRAEERIQELVAPALRRITTAIADDDNPALALAAARDILDRAGYKATEKVQQDGRVVIEIEMVDRVSPSAIRHALESPPPSNGVKRAADSTP
jgi:hypothetical protein